LKIVVGAVEGGIVVATSNSPAVTFPQLNDILFNALVFNWNELMPDSATGQVQIEYHSGPTGSMEFVKVWGATIRGHWNLICEQWHSTASKPSELRFANGHKSEVFHGMLDSIMQHQELFQPGIPPGMDGMIQVSPPTDQERIAALKMMDAFRDRLNS
jgi:hypothetical protein